MGQSESSLIDQMLAEKQSRKAEVVYPGVRDWYKQTFGADIPIRNLGASDFERSVGWEHSRSFDVGLNPNTNEGKQLISYLQSQGIPYSAFTSPVYRNGRTVATGPHIHVGPPSQRITDQGSQDQGSSSLIDQLLAEKSQAPAPTIRNTYTDKRGSYMAQAQAFRNQPALLQKLGNDIAWHFGDRVLANFDQLPKDKQIQIAQDATKFAAADEEKKRQGIPIIKSAAWQQANQNRVKVKFGPTAQEREAQAKAERDASNPFLALPGPLRAPVEALAVGGSGIVDALNGVLQYAIPGITSVAGGVVNAPGLEAVSKSIGAGMEEVRQRSAEVPHTAPVRIARDVAGGLIEYAPMALLPETEVTGLLGRLAKIGELAVKGGTYSGLQAAGQGKTEEEQAKSIGSGAGQFALLGVLPPIPKGTVLPTKKAITRLISSTAIVGGGTTLINLADGKPLSDAATQGFIMTVLHQAPELIGRFKIKGADGVVRPATREDFYKLMNESAGRLRLPPAGSLEGYEGPVAYNPKSYELETGTPKPSGPATINLPAKQAGTAEVVRPGEQGELFTATRPGEEAGREDLPGFNPTPLSKEAYAQSKGMDLNDPLTDQFYKEYLDRVKSSAGRPAAAPPKYAQWEKEAAEAEDAWNKRKEGGETFSGNVEAKVQEAIKNARENGPTPEFRAFFGGIEPRLAGTTIKAVAAFARKLGMKWEPQAGWLDAEKTAASAATSAPGAGATGSVKGGLGAAPEGTAETPPPATEKAPPRAQTKVGGTPQPMQMEFTLPGQPSQGTPIFDSRLEDPQAALVRLQRLRMDPEIWNNLSPEDRQSIGKSIAALKSGKTPAEIMDEQALTSQYPGTIRMSEETARKNLQDWQKQFDELKAKKTRTKAEKAVMGALKRNIDALTEQGVGELSEKPAATEEPTQRQDPLGLTTRERLEAPWRVKAIRRLQEQVKKEQAANGTRETLQPPVDSTTSAGTVNASREGERGAASVGAISGGIVDKINAARQAITHLAATRGVRAAITYTRDAVDNMATILGNEKRNDVRGILAESFGMNRSDISAGILRDPNKVIRNALSFFIESGGDTNRLAQMRTQIEASPTANLGWKKQAIAAIEFAQQHPNELRPAADRYRQITDELVANEQANGIDTLRRNNYVPHMQDFEGAYNETGLLSRGGTGETTGFKKVRTHETFADSISAGVDPKSLDALQLLNNRVANGAREINRQAWGTELKNTIDPRSGLPVMADPITITRADGTTYKQAPNGYKMETLGPNRQVAIKNGYEGIYSALTDPSAFSKTMARREFMAANAVGKSISLVLDTFHLARLAIWESVIKAAGIKTFKAPFPSYRKGILLLDSSVPEIQRMIASGEIPARFGNNLLENKRVIDLLVKHGFNIGGISDSMHQQLLHNLPVLGHFNKWLFNQFQRGAMTEVGLLEFERIRRALPNLSEADAARRVAHDLNIRFGNIGRQGALGFAWSKTGLDAARALFLAPQWNEGLIRSELGAVKGLADLPIDLIKNKGLYGGVLLRSVGGLALGQFAANQLLNMYFRGHPTWDNPEEDWGAKVSAYIPDYKGGPGFFLHPMGLAAETAHLLMKGFARSDDLRQAITEYARSRLSIAARGVATLFSARDYLGRIIRPENVLKEAAKASIPTPIPYNAIAQGIRGHEEFPGQFQKQLMSSFLGLKTDPVPSGEQRLRRLASQFNTAHGIERQGEFYTDEDTPYLKLNQSLGKAGAMEALKEQLQTKSKQDIRQYYYNRIDRPLTGKEDRERVFKKTLNAEQLEQYKKIREERRKDYHQISELLNKVGVVLPPPKISASPTPP